jgi:hypothetical protein
MKKLVISLSMLLCVGAVKAQNWGADVGLKYAYSATELFNKNISDLGASQDYDLAFSSNYGVAGLFNMGKIGVGVEYLVGNFKAGYQGTVGTTAYTSLVDLKTTQIPLYLRLGETSGSFGEFGIVMNSMKTATYSNSFLSNPTDVTAKYQSFMGLMLGVGGRFGVGDLPIKVSLGARFMYSLADAKGVDALGAPLSAYATPQKTNAASVGLHLGVIYAIK